MMKRNRIFTKIIFVVVLIAIIPLLFFCKKNDQNLVPYVYVNFPVYINQGQYTDLQTVGNSIYVTGGVCGIIIYRKSLDEFIAIERCCAYNPGDRCAVNKDSSQNGALICPCCKSKFSIYDGSVIKTPASHPLTMYKATFDQYNSKVQITNN